ncbi:glycosyltransferase (plasmid) [Klebsiella pneumoniae]|uniref:glycosyltransferase family 2 protein n=1 Tax=Klebsiella pneumoniae complex TaxID=3390273 RepID=UPI0018802A83|nr:MULTISPECIES: glycosyltransferase [Klebsiella]ELT0799126.1 glycosyltransferase [Klebsiella quasipneumoniae]MBE8829214.1 glycosyltransferase [Klebsiella quasipneumoniae]MCF0455614.1 glycosyltransferase [Klebsiella pneumoniae]MCP2569283.1 glycosyltransferase [Klebsiella pneumoniae]MCQ1001402.1 glycosyltransferase [Klebsiella pneumoniae]
MNSAVTIVMPMYNSERYIKKTLESIAMQSLSNFRVIVVDDGSTDDSVGIVSDFLCSDNRFELYKKENSGVSDSRNYGLSMVESEYVVFIDSDDLLDKSHLNDMYLCASADGSDITMCDYNVIYQGKIRRINTYLNDGADGYIRDTLTAKMWGVVWNKMFRLDFLRKNNILFHNDILFWEDLAFCIKAFSCTDKISHTQKPTYNYLVRDGSLLRSENNKAKVMNKISSVNEISKIRKISENFKVELDALKLQAKSEFISDHNMYDRDLWKATLPVGFLSIVMADTRAKNKLLPLLSSINLNIAVSFLMTIKRFRSKIRSR